LGWLTFNAPAQTTNGLVTGAITDASGAVIPGTVVTIVNKDTAQERTATSDASGLYVIPQLAPGSYVLTAKKEGFATVKQENILLLVNQSVTVDVKLTVASIAQTIEVTEAPPQLNTTSSTLSEVVEHQETVDLPLNGREFTQLALLTPGTAPQEGGQQSGFTVSLGSGGISPAVSGQRADQNDFTLDGVLNNSIFTNVWVISPPPDAIEEFNVQTHITDAQFAISSGANINLVTRSGTNRLHGDLWEFIRNDDLDAQTYPDTERLTYRQNQYGLFLGGPITIPHIYDGKDKTWFSGYWEGYRYTRAGTQLGSTLTKLEKQGDFSAEEGTTQLLDANNNPITDANGDPVFANEIFDPTSSVYDPVAKTYSRTPFPAVNGVTNIIPQGSLNAASLAYAAKFYPDANMDVAEGVTPNYKTTAPTTIKSDVFGAKLDHRFTADDNVWGRFNRSSQHSINPYYLGDVENYVVQNFAQVGALGYTHMFNPKTILDFRYGYTYFNNYADYGTTDPALVTAMGFSDQDPVHDGLQLPPNASIGDNYSGAFNFAIPLGPIQTMDYHLDLSKVIGNHTIGVGGLYYHIRSYDDGWGEGTTFAHNGTSSDGTINGSGFGPASFLLGTLDSYAPWVGATGADQTVNWYGWYAQDTWQATRDLVITAGIRWDFVTPPNYHRVESGLNMSDGSVCITGAVTPLFPKATCPSGYFYSQKNGWEPRFGITYKATNRTVIHGAGAILDDHNNTLVQANQGIRLSWPDAAEPTYSSLDIGLPTQTPYSNVTSAYWGGMPTVASMIGPNSPFSIGYGANPHNRIPYSIEYNFGIQEQLQQHMSLKADYVGSVGRFGYTDSNTNTAPTPGAGTISSRAPYPQYGIFEDEDNNMPSSYNSLQVELNKQMSSGLSFKVSYTWSKSMDWQSDPYGSEPVDWYNMKPDWGPSDYNRPQMLIISGLYQLPVGKDRRFLNNSKWLTQGALGGWTLGTIITADSGAPFNVMASGDIANTGWSSQRAQRTSANPYSPGGGGGKAMKQWLNPAGFTDPVKYTRGNESRNDLHAPSYNDVDFNATKNFHLYEGGNLIFKAEMFNIFNHTNYGTPVNTVPTSANNDFGQILGSNGYGRLVQFGLKVQF
jgi:hypothetical protein